MFPPLPLGGSFLYHFQQSSSPATNSEGYLSVRPRVVLLLFSSAIIEPGNSPADPSSLKSCM